MAITELLRIVLFLAFLRFSPRCFRFARTQVKELEGSFFPLSFQWKWTSRSPPAIQSVETRRQSKGIPPSFSTRIFWNEPVLVARNASAGRAEVYSLRGVLPRLGVPGVSFSVRSSRRASSMWPHFLRPLRAQPSDVPDVLCCHPTAGGSQPPDPQHAPRSAWCLRHVWLERTQGAVFTAPVWGACSCRARRCARRCRSRCWSRSDAAVASAAAGASRRCNGPG